MQGNYVSLFLTTHGGGGAERLRSRRLAELIRARLVPGFLLLSTLTACTPQVQVTPSDKPIEININAKIDHQVRIKVERDVEELIAENDDLF